MRTTLFLKQTDLVLQVLGLLVPIAWAALTLDLRPCMMAYIAVGGVQILSCIYHRISFDKFLRHASRLYYERVLLTVVILVASVGVVCSEAIVLPLFGLLIVSPLMAIWYWILCYRETRLISRQVDRKQYV